jgi:hypothetical protein
MRQLSASPGVGVEAVGLVIFANADPGAAVAAAAAAIAVVLQKM